MRVYVCLLSVCLSLSSLPLSTVKWPSEGVRTAMEEEDVSLGHYLASDPLTFPDFIHHKHIVSKQSFHRRMAAMQTDDKDY